MLRTRGLVVELGVLGSLGGDGERGGGGGARREERDNGGARGGRERV